VSSRFRINDLEIIPKAYPVLPLPCVARSSIVSEWGPHISSPHSPPYEPPDDDHEKDFYNIKRGTDEGKYIIIQGQQWRSELINIYRMSLILVPEAGFEPAQD
jgi:hypothetical protein